MGGELGLGRGWAAEEAVWAVERNGAELIWRLGVYHGQVRAVEKIWAIFGAGTTFPGHF